MPRAYETMVIVRPDVVDENLEQLLNAQREMLQQNGATAVETQIRGKRRFTFEMQGYKEGLFVQMNYEAEPTAVSTWERSMRLNESILRYMTLREENVS